MRKIIAAFFVASLMSIAAFAADPSGTWTWTFAPAGGGQGGQGGQGGGGGGRGMGGPQSLTLTLKDGNLTGMLAGGRGEPVAISAATFKDDTVQFSVTRQGRDGNQIVTKYMGKLSGDTITGTSEGPARGGEVMKRDWVATRAK